MGLIVCTGVALVLLLIIGLPLWSLTWDTQPQQTIMSETVSQGDVHYLCVEWRTGDRVDTASCTMLDPQTGKALQ
ncbi:tight junction protein ZO-3 [Bifidobacterium saguini]|uniref:Tight junction protein ZO-3 n=1 Tax=Bifidobacterium saguini TaxID=762210 RepID=A0ABX7SEE7_9BIFI|nr:tight junction protein ZO-3 [Bifidobacterium saguini]QTB90883.1 tight junction protein ZO-3 [Bifidobacterium saguini]